MNSARHVLRLDEKRIVGPFERAVHDAVDDTARIDRAARQRSVRSMAPADEVKNENVP